MKFYNSCTDNRIYRHYEQEMNSEWLLSKMNTCNAREQRKELKL